MSPTILYFSSSFFKMVIIYIYARIYEVPILEYYSNLISLQIYKNAAGVLKTCVNSSNSTLLWLLNLSPLWNLKLSLEIHINLSESARKTPKMLSSLLQSFLAFEFSTKASINEQSSYSNASSRCFPQLTLTFDEEITLLHAAFTVASEDQF